MITYNIDVFFGRNEPEKQAVVKCHDTGVCLRVFFKTEEKTSKYRTAEKAYTCPAGSVAVVKITKPDKKCVVQDGICQGSNAFFELPPQAFTAAGMASAEINLFNPEGRRITSETFFIEVPKEVADDCAVDSENYVSLMAEQIQAAVDAAERAEEAAERAENAQGKELIESLGIINLYVCSDGEYTAEGCPVIDAPEENTAYLVPQDSEGTKYASWVYANGAWEFAEMLTVTLDEAEGYTPQKGVDYYTDADKQEMVNAVIAALPVYGGEVAEV